MEPNNVKFSRYLWKIFFLHFSFSVDYNRAVNWSSNMLELLPSNIAKFCIILLVETEQIKDFETFTYVFITSVQLPTSLSSNAGYRIHPYLVGRIIRHDTHSWFIKNTNILFYISWTEGSHTVLVISC